MAEHCARRCNRSLKARRWLAIQTQDAEKLSQSIISQKTWGGGYRAKGSVYPRVMMSTTNSGALRVDFQKSTAALNRPLTPQLVFKELSSPRFPENKQKNQTQFDVHTKPPSSSPRLVTRGQIHSVTQQT